MEGQQPNSKPSLFVWAVIGYLFAALVAGVTCWVLAYRSNNFDNRDAFTLFVCLGGLGALMGYELAVRRRKKLGVNEPSDEWRQFFGSLKFNVLAGIVLVGSLVLSVAESLLFDLVYGAPWLQRR